MKQAGIFALAAILLAAGEVGCDRREHGHPETREGANEPPVVAVTRWTERSELFMEYPVLVAGATGRFAIHVTDLSNFEPLDSGEAVVVLRGDGGGPLEFRGGTSRPGIFGVDVTPEQPGRYTMSVRVASPELQDLHELGEVIVYPPGTALPREEQADGEAITFLKEQQWTLEFATEPVVIRTLQSSNVVPATVRPRSGGDAILSAPVPGRIDPSTIAPVIGTSVRSGTVLARIIPRSDEVRDAPALRVALVEAEQQHGLAQKARDRAQRLVQARALPLRRLSEAEAALSTADARVDAARQQVRRFELLSGAAGAVSGGDLFAVRAPFDGVVVEARFAPGASVEAGEPLLRIVDAARVHVVGSVPESQASVPRSIESAELLLDHGPPLPLGRPLSVGSVIEPVTRTFEVRYAFDNGEAHLQLAQAVRLRLFLGHADTLPTVPESAVIDDGGRPVIFVQIGGESFARRAVQLGSRSAGYIHVLQGVEAGERVVSQGAYLVRLAAMSSQIPAHGHVH